MDDWVLWLLLVGLIVGAVITWLLLVRLPREDADVDADERRSEAAWIAASIDQRGGIAPIPFVEEVLDLHSAYLHAPRLSAPAMRPPVPPASRPPVPPATRPPA